MKHRDKFEGFNPISLLMISIVIIVIGGIYLYLSQEKNLMQDKGVLYFSKALKNGDNSTCELIPQDTNATGHQINELLKIIDYDLPVDFIEHVNNYNLKTTCSDLIYMKQKFKEDTKKIKNSVAQTN